MIGLGMGAARVIREIRDLPFIRLVGGVDLRRAALDSFEQEFGARVFTDVEGLCSLPEVEAVYVATPHDLHAAHAIAAMNHGKHVIVEKPMALNLAEADRMIEAAERNRVRLLCGHTHSFDAPIRRMCQLLQEGRFGRTLMIHTLYYKNFMYRPWSDRDVELSRGVVLNQGPHQVDIVRLLGGGMVRSVRGSAGRWDPQRPGEGHYCAFLEFEGGLPAVLTFNGYALFDTSELVWDIGEGGERPKDVGGDREARRFFMTLDGGPERASRIEARLERWRYGGAEPGAWFVERARVHQPFFGVTLVSCEGAEIRQSPDGIYVYTDGGRSELPLEREQGGRIAEMREMYDAVREEREVFHDGRWGRATLEVCLGLLESSASGREVLMSRQVPAPVLV